MIDETSLAERTATWPATFRHRFRISPNLRDRVLFTLAMLALYRVGYFIPTPGVNIEALQILAAQATDAGLVFYSLTSGNLSQATVFALGLTPYISAAILVQLLALFWPRLKRLSREGEPGRRTITQYTRYGALILSAIQALALAFFLERQTNVAGGLPLVYEPGLSLRLTTVATMTAGTGFIIWLGDRISERGVGNGLALIIVVQIVTGFPIAVLATVEQMTSGRLGLLRLLVVISGLALLVGVVVRSMRGRRRLKVRYPEQIAAGRRVPSTTVNMTLKLNMSGVMPLILATDVIGVVLATAGSVSGWGESLHSHLEVGMPLWYLLNVGLILLLAFYYIAIIFDSEELARNLRKYGATIPGLRPGKQTADRIDAALMGTAATWGLCLAVVTVVSGLVTVGFRADAVPVIGSWLDANLPGPLINGLNLPFYFGGAPLLLLLAVLLDTQRQAQVWQDAVCKENFVPVAVPSGAGMESLISSVLKSAGIRRLIRNEGVQDLFGLGRIGTGFNTFAGTPTVCVEPLRVEEASALLARIDGEQRVGTVAHYFDKPQVAAVCLTDDVEVGDKVRCRGHGADFQQSVVSMQINHESVQSASAQTVVAIKLEQRVHPGTEVCRVRAE